jgi:4-amino-4-deoxy-L-arabinose transferase-like glycosyltransferase
MVTSTAKSTRSNDLVVLLALIVGVGWKLLLLWVEAFPFNADEAIVGIMAQDIVEGARPIFFYGQAYMGSLDAYLVSIGFGLFGQSVWVIRLVQLLLYGGVFYTTLRIATHLHGKRSAILATGLLLAFPTINFTLYTTVSLGGYGEVLLLGNLLILLTIQLGKNQSRTYAILWGIVAGLGFWAFGMMLVYIIPCLLYIFRVIPRTKMRPSIWIFTVCGFLIGSLPLWIWVLQFGFETPIRELFGSAIAGSSSNNRLEAIFLHTRNFLIFGPTVILGFRPPWHVEPLGLALLPFAIAFWFLVLLHTVLRRRSFPGSPILRLFGGVVVVLLGGFVLTPFGSDPSGRYFLPLMIPLALVGGEFVSNNAIKIRAGFRWSLLAGALAFNVLATTQAANSPSRITTQFDAVARIDQSYMEELVRFLSREGETRGYSNYWVAYPLAFHSNEALIYSPALPYHLDFRYTDRDDRIPAYRQAVEESESVALITTKHPELDQIIRTSLRLSDIKWQEKVIGDYQIFYNLSGSVSIQELQNEWKDESAIRDLE